MFKYLKFLLFLSIPIFVSGNAAAQSAGVGALEYLVTTIEGNSPLRSLLEDNKLFIVTQNSGLFVLDVTDFQHPIELAKNSETGFLNGGIQKRGNLIYVSDGLNGILVFEYDGKDVLTKKYEYKTTTEVWDISIVGNILYAAESSKGLVVYKINEDGSLVNDGGFKDIKWGWAWRIQTYGDSLYVADKDAGVKVFNISKPEDPGYITSFTTNGTPKDIYVEDGLIYVANGPSGLSVFALNNQGRAREVEKVSLTKGGDIQSIIKSGRYFFVSGGNSGVYILLKRGNGRLKTEFSTNQPGEDIGITKRNLEVYVSSANGLKVYKYNSPPILAEIPKQSIKENSELVFVRSGFDPDSASIVISAENLPEGAEYDIEKSTFKWTPNFEQSGRYQVYFIISENTDQALFDTDTVTVTVNHVNRKPEIAQESPKLIDEAQLLSFKLPEGTDPDREDQGKLKQFALNLPEGATFNAETFQFDWKPTYKQSGVYNVQYGVKDPDGFEDVKTVVITVKHVNLTPTIADIGSQKVDENQNLAFTFAWADEDIEDNGKLVVDLAGIPSGATFDNKTGIFNWIPTFTQSGSYDIVLKVSDSNSDSLGVKFAEKIVNITVNHISRTPIIADLKDITINEDQVLSTVIRNYDLDTEDFGKLVLTATDLPKGAVLNDSTLSWTPDYFQAGDYVLNFKVTEPLGLNSSKTLKIKVNNVNRMPVIAEFTNPFESNENDLMTVKYSISDPDLEILKITIDKVPAGAVFDEATQTLTWTPTFEQAGKYDYTITAIDPLLGKTTALQSIMIKNVNRVPMFTELTDQSVKEVETLTFKLTASDPDKQAVVVTTSELPGGSKYDAKTGSFTWKPTYEQSGSYPITFTATDPENAVTTKLVTITVANVNRTPTLAKINAVKNKENETISITAVGADPDMQKLTYSSPDAPKGMAVNAENGTISWQPGYDQAGKYTTTLVVTDPEGAKAEVKVQFDIANVNREPVISGLSDQTYTEGESVSYTVSATDPDGDALTYSLTGKLPKGAKFDAKSATFTWTPAAKTLGSFGPFTVKVTDSGKASASGSFSIIIKEKPAPPPAPVQNPVEQVPPAEVKP